MQKLIVSLGTLVVPFSLTMFPGGGVAQAAPPPRDAIVRQEFVFEKAPFPQCHASTLSETKSGLVAAWFGGTREKHPDVGIWISRYTNGRWSPPREVANGVQADGTRFPCWNPVLFQPEKGPLLLFYKVGPSPSRWWGMVMHSDDGGKTWSTPRRLPAGILGPIKNKPVELADGTLLSGSSTEHDGWRVHVERSRDGGKTWQKSKPLNDGRTIAAIQPTFLEHSDGRLQMLCRSRQGKIVTSFSSDKGRTWSPLRLTNLPNPNSGIDAVTLKDGTHLLVYNHTQRGRSPLNVAVSRDGRHWQMVVVLENKPGEYSYPAVIQTADGMVHITYTWKRRRIRHVVLDPARLKSRE